MTTGSDPALVQLARLRALRAVMDGLGLDALVLRDGALVALIAAEPGVLVVRAAEATLIGGEALPEAPGPIRRGTMDEALAGARHVGTDAELAAQIARILQQADENGPPP